MSMVSLVVFVFADITGRRMRKVVDNFFRSGPVQRLRCTVLMCSRAEERGRKRKQIPQNVEKEEENTSKGSISGPLFFHPHPHDKHSTISIPTTVPQVAIVIHQVENSTRRCLSGMPLWLVAVSCTKDQVWEKSQS